MFRMVALLGPSVLKSYFSEGKLESPEAKWGCNGNGVYESDSFINAFHHFGSVPILDNEEYSKHKELFLRTTISVFLTKCLATTSFFKDSSPSQLEISKLFMHFLHFLPANAHDIGELELLNKNVFSGSKMTSLGAGLYNTLSLFNHSCDHNFMRANIGKDVVCITVKDIKKGQEITENYGLSYAYNSLEKRQKICKEHYGFECKCIACVNNWQVKHLLQKVNDFQVVQATENALKYLRYDKITISRWNLALEEIQKVLKSFPNPGQICFQKYQVQNAIWEFLWMSSGNKRLAKN